MDKAWGSGDPTEFIDDLYYTSYDGHIYLKWAGIETKDAYINTSCSDLLDNMVYGVPIVSNMEWNSVSSLLCNY